MYRLYQTTEEKEIQSVQLASPLCESASSACEPASPLCDQTQDDDSSSDNSDASRVVIEFGFYDSSDYPWNEVKDQMTSPKGESLTVLTSGSDETVIRRLETILEEPAPLDNVNGPILFDEFIDPFATREGKTLQWRNVNMTLSESRNGQKLLDNVWGEVPKKKTTAILGPSGAGKTSLLNILAGRVRTNRRMQIQSDIRLDNYIVDPSDIRVRKAIAFVAQDDSLQVTATPREAIRFSAKMRLPRSTTENQLDQLTNRMLVELGLSACADTIVGGALIKGISGGERKRTAVGVELVVKPALLCLDEPTSGLDSFSAVQCCQLLKKVADAGASVLFTIHQPSSEIFESFDHLILLNKGRVMFQGSVEEVSLYFSHRGFPCPNNYNPADWIMSVAQSKTIKQLDGAGFFPRDERSVPSPAYPSRGQDALGRMIGRKHMCTNQDPPSDFLKTGLLLGRELKHIIRDRNIIVARVLLTGFLALLVGTIFMNVGSSSNAVAINVQSHFGALVLLLMMSMLATAQQALLSFPDERPVFLREFCTDHYSVISYFVSRLLAEAVITGVQVFIMVMIMYYMIQFQADLRTIVLTVYTLAMASTAQAVMLGCLAGKNLKIAVQLLPLIFVPQMLFAGFFVSPSLIPSWLQWIQMVCTMTYGVRILLVAEFENCSTYPVEKLNCDLLLYNTQSNPDDVWWYWLVLVGLFVVFRLLAFFILRRSASTFY